MGSKEYYAPSIEDIRVGYECEVWKEYWNKEYKGEEWKPWIFNYQDIQFAGLDGATTVGLLFPHFPDINPTRIRTPYLTKEKIMGEGWRDFNHTKEIWLVKRDWVCKLYSNGIELSYIGSIKYKGPCPSINEFKYINKLLGV